VEELALVVEELVEGLALEEALALAMEKDLALGLVLVSALVQEAQGCHNQHCSDRR